MVIAPCHSVEVSDHRVITHNSDVIETVSAHSGWQAWEVALGERQAFSLSAGRLLGSIESGRGADIDFVLARSIDAGERAGECIGFDSEFKDSAVACSILSSAGVSQEKRPWATILKPTCPHDTSIRTSPHIQKIHIRPAL